jgi:tRNA-dihydrouridine synthase B
VTPGSSPPVVPFLAAPRAGSPSLSRGGPSATLPLDSPVPAFRIGPVPVYSEFVLAPMAAVTDTHFRRAIKRLGGCGFVFSQLISVEGIIRENARTLEMMRYTEEERPVAIQLFGAEPETMARAARAAQATGADIIDINVGCPAKKIVKGGGGCALMREPELLKEIIQSVKAELTIPLTIKIRAGWDGDSLNYLPVALMARDCGVAAITLHPRTRMAEFSGQADWTLIGRLKRELDIPVLGSGDVRSPEMALALLERTGCDGVMIGRAATANPWIFRQCREMKARGVYATPDRRDTCLVLFDLLRSIIQDSSEEAALGKIKNLVGRFSKGLSDSAAFRDAIFKAERVAEAQSVLERFLLS